MFKKNKETYKDIKGGLFPANSEAMPSLSMMLQSNPSNNNYNYYNNYNNYNNNPYKTNDSYTSSNESYSSTYQPSYSSTYQSSYSSVNQPNNNMYDQQYSSGVNYSKKDTIDNLIVDSNNFQNKNSNENKLKNTPTSLKRVNNVKNTKNNSNNNQNTKETSYTTNSNKNLNKNLGNNNQLLRKQNMAYVVKIQSNFRGYLARKKIKKLINTCNKARKGVDLLQKLFSEKKKDIFHTIAIYNKKNAIKLRGKISNIQKTRQNANITKSQTNKNNQKAPQDNNNQKTPQNNTITKSQTFQNRFTNTNIDNLNRIIINIPRIEKFKNNINILIKKKYLLKYLILKKETKLNKILKINFEKYKKNALIEKKTIINKEEKEEQKEQETKESTNKESDKESKLKRLRDIVKKKIFRNTEFLHRVFLKYYYKALYIHLNWYMYVVNQLTYTQNYYTSLYNNNNNTTVITNNNDINNNNIINNSSNTTINTNNKDKNNNNNSNNAASNEPDLLKQFSSEHSETHNEKVNNAIRESIITINKMNDKDKNPEEAFRESIMTINKISDELSKEAKEKKLKERNKHLKDLVVKRLKELKNIKHHYFMKFYYQGKLAEQERINEERELERQKEREREKEANNNGEGEIKIENSGPTKLRGRKKNEALDRRNKARNLRKLMMKKEKEKMEQLRFYFLKFHSNGMLFQLKKNAKISLSTKNVLIYPNLNNIDLDLEPSKSDIKGLTYVDKILLEKKLEKEKLLQKRKEALQVLFYKLDRHNMLTKRKIFEKWNLRAKILSLSKISTTDLKKSTKKKKLRGRKKESKNIENEKKNENENEQKNEN